MTNSTALVTLVSKSAVLCSRPPAIIRRVAGGNAWATRKASERATAATDGDIYHQRKGGGDTTSNKS